MKTTFIKVTWDFVGFHKFHKAADNVAFLRDIHRHKFKCSAMIEVFHDDRELEFFTVQDELSSIFSRKSQDLKSCEMIASDICDFILKKYGERELLIEVSEDGENSSLVKYTCE